MDLLNLLEFISGLDEQEKEEALNEEYHRQRTIIDSLCECKRIKEAQANVQYRIK